MAAAAILTFSLGAGAAARGLSARREIPPGTWQDLAPALLARSCAIFWQSPEGTGTSFSGFFWQSSGDTEYVLTCAHGIGEGGETWVQNARGVTRTARVVGKDRETDVALLAVPEGEGNEAGGGLGEEKEATEWAKDVQWGTPVCVCANANGEGLTLSAGVISRPGESTPDSPLRYHRTDLLLGPGSSGGGVFDTAGRCVGMVCFRVVEASETEGFSRALGYLLPAETLQAAAEALLAAGE